LQACAIVNKTLLFGLPRYLHSPFFVLLPAAAHLKPLFQR
jgi:hypothetical protein